MRVEDKVTKNSASGSAEEGQKGRSTIEFPYLDLEDAVEIATNVNAIGGSGCEWDQLAAQLKVAAQGGGFRLRMITAKMFGLLTYERGSVALTPLGMRIADAQHARKARTEAFLSVPLYRAIYDKFRSVSLPPTAGLEREIESLGVTPKQKEKARQVFLRSAKQAGFFEFGTDRLVLPAGINGAPKEAVPERNDPTPKPRGGQDGGALEGLHPFIQGLLQSLPDPLIGEWPLEARARWLQTAAGIFDLMYIDNSDASGRVTVNVEYS